MGRALLLPVLLLLLPLATGWTTSNCLVTEGSWLHLVSRFFLVCPLDSKLSFLAVCISVSNVTRAVEVLPQSIEGLCLAGSVSSLPPNAFSKFPGLKVLGLILHLTRVLPGALQGLRQLRQLSFISRLSQKNFSLPPDVLSDLPSLQQLYFLGPCLERKAGIQLPPNVSRLAVTYNCLQDLGELDDMFPELAPGSTPRNTWALDKLDLSFNFKLKMVSPGSLWGLRLESLRLDHTEMEAAAVRDLGLQSLKALSVKYSATVEFPAETVAHFELQELSLGYNRIAHIAQEVLASCHSLKSLGLQSNRLTKLPPGFLMAMPRLQRLNLAGNQLQSFMLCANETRAASELWTLNLSSNRLRVLPPATFSCLPNLRELLLRNNQLVYLDSWVFQSLQQLETLNLDENPLVNLAEDWLAALPALTTLSLLDTHMLLSPASDFRGAEGLQTLKLQLPPALAGAVLSLPMNLTSLELRAAADVKHWKLSSTVFPVLQTLTLQGSVDLGIQNASEVFPDLRQLFLRGNVLESFCSQDTSSVFLWQLPRLQSLKIQRLWGNSRPCCITGLPNLQELKLDSLQSYTQPRSVQLEELVGELPRLQVLQLASTGLKSLSASAFQHLGRLQVLMLDNEKGLVLDDSLREHSPQMPQYVYILFSSLACQCANAWVESWLKWSPKTYICILGNQLCPKEVGNYSKHPLFPFLWNHCPQTLEFELFVVSFVLLLLLVSLPLVQEAKNSWILYLRALFRVWLQGLKGRKNREKRFRFDVFVSHCRQDQDWVVQELLPVLEGPPPGGQGLRLCLPERDFELGKDVADNVADSVVGSRVTLCVLSRQALCTPRCRLELRLATALLLTAPFPPVLLLVFLEPVSRHQLPGYHRLARLLRGGDYCLWPKEDERKDGFWAWLRSRLGQPGLE